MGPAKALGTEAMIDRGKANLLGVTIDAVDYEAAADKVIQAAKAGQPYGVSALAVHGVMEGVFDRDHRHRLNALELVVPDGQPVRWGLNLLYKTALPDRVYGPRLMLRLCERSAAEGLSIYLYGSSAEVLNRLVPNLSKRYPGLVIAGAEPSKFRQTSQREALEIARRIRASGASLTFVGLGCPRQEVFTYEYRKRLAMPVLAVGAAFDYHAGVRREPPAWLQRAGLQWLDRFVREPRRLWRRYLLLNPLYLALVGLQAARLWRPSTRGRLPAADLHYG